MSNRPTPDPSWDYAVIWQELCEMESKLNEIFDFLQKQETSTSVADAHLLFLMGNLDGKLDRIFDLENPQ